MRRRLLTAAALVVGLVMVTAVTAPVASAVPPSRSSVQIPFQDSLAVCGFPVAVDGFIALDFTLFFDQHGNLTREIDQAVEEDTFSANGQTLTSEPFRFTMDTTYDADGGLVSMVVTGGIMRVPLPGGKVFWSAGRYDFVNHPEVTFTITPDNGHSGNVEAFCAALTKSKP